MKTLKNFGTWAAACVAAVMMASCGSDSPDDNSKNKNENNETPTVTETGFAKGADVSWLTKLESEGYTFKTSAGVQKECMTLLKEECGVNAIRLRVWVNPSDGWNNQKDVLIKARRANKLGLRLMIDFHFSDTWADPSNQAVPEAWKNYNMTQLKAAMTSHVNSVLTALKNESITPEWVQIGNETVNGMMYPLGNFVDNPGNFAELVTNGYEAVKAVCPNAKVIVHLDQGDDQWRYDHVFGDELSKYGAKYDLIGMSLYPEVSNWSSKVSSCLSNISYVVNKYGKDVIICEVGMNYDQAAACNSMITALKKGAEENGHVEGIFYWEPEAPAGYNGGYSKGCFQNGTPTEALNSFK